MTYLSQQAVVRNYPHEWKKAERKVWFSAHEVEYLVPGHSKSATHEGCVALEYELRYLAAEHRINGGPVRGVESLKVVAVRLVVLGHLGGNLQAVLLQLGGEQRV